MFWGSVLPGRIPFPPPIHKKINKTHGRHILFYHQPSSFVSTTQSNKDIICVLKVPFDRLNALSEIYVNRAILPHNESLLGQSVKVSGLELVSTATISSPHSILTIHLKHQ